MVVRYLWGASYYNQKSLDFIDYWAHVEGRRTLSSFITFAESGRKSSNAYLSPWKL